MVWVLFTLSLIGANPAFCATESKVKAMLDNADQCRKELYLSSTKMKYRHHWAKCINQYETIYKAYPNSEYAPWAMYHTARMFTKLYTISGKESDLDEALDLYDLLIRKYTTHRLADDSQYYIGEIHDKYKKDPAQAYVEYLKVEIKYPSGDMKEKARVRLDDLAVVLGKKADSNSNGSAASSPSERTRVKGIRHWSTPTYTRVVIDLDNPVEYSSHLLKRDPDLDMPKRLYLDLENTFVDPGIETTIPIQGGLLQRARAGQFDPDTVRVVLDAQSVEEYKVFPLYNPFRIVVDVQAVEINDQSGNLADAIIPKPTRTPRRGVLKTTQPDQALSLAGQLGLSVKTIVIDPGHGGKDPGCHLGKGIMEKDIVLALAKILKKEIEEKLGCEVLLTRTQDVFVPLDERTAFANVHKADLFISLHINAHRQKNVFGVETYFLNMATDQDAVVVAARENATSEKNISDLQTILNNLLLNTKISESSKLAYEVQDGMMDHIKIKYNPIRDLGVKQAPFYVLVGAQMPAILVETGFITNDTERKRLQSDSYRQVLANGIVKGIESYINGIEMAFSGG
ncbi:MAG: N-acetylmuramoyl-L-alanine amidase [Deltaproteobacteria bacterium]|nr:N-acetylmuramoyl-L-alanine amidase [Deltaproteobacteria bacterium]